MPFILNEARDLLSIISDSASILGLLISAFTLYLAAGIRKKMLEQHEKERFRNEASKILDDLKAIEVSMSNDHLFTKKIIEKLDRQCEKLINEFSSALKRSKHHIKKVEKKSELLLVEMENRNDEKATDAYYNKKTRRLTKALLKAIAELEKDRVLT